MWMIMEASYKPREKRVGNVTVHLVRGQLACAVRFMADAWNWTKSTVDRFLKRLENRDMIGTDSGTGVNVITICKYDEYQNKPKDGGTDEIENRDSSGTAAGQQRDKPNKGLIPDAIQEPKGEVDHLQASDDVLLALNEYNSAADRQGWPKVQSFTSERRKLLASRLRDAGGLRGWSDALAKAEASDFICGRASRSWAGFSFDGLVSKSKFTRLMEGNYDNRNQNNSPESSAAARPGANRATENLMAGFAAVAARHSGPTQ